jgi:hypothetical protein
MKLFKCDFELKRKMLLPNWSQRNITRRTSGKAVCWPFGASTATVRRAFWQQRTQHLVPFMNGPELLCPQAPYPVTPSSWCHYTFPFPRHVLFVLQAPDLLLRFRFCSHVRTLHLLPCNSLHAKQEI